MNGIYTRICKLLLHQNYYLCPYIAINLCTLKLYNVLPLSAHSAGHRPVVLDRWPWHFRRGIDDTSHRDITATSHTLLGGSVHSSSSEMASPSPSPPYRVQTLVFPLPQHFLFCSTPVTSVVALDLVLCF